MAHMSVKAEGSFTMSNQEPRVQAHHVEIHQAIHLHWLLTPIRSKYRYIEISWGQYWLRFHFSGYVR